MRRDLSGIAIIGGLLLVGVAASADQEPPPISGVTGSIGLEGTVEKTYEGANTVIVKAVDGIEHLFHLTGRTVVHGGKAGSGEALRGIDEGSRVVVHYTADGTTKTADEVDRVAADGLKSVEGVVSAVDRRAKTISIRLGDGSRETLLLTDRAAADIGKDVDTAAAGTARVVVYFGDETGRQVAHYFKRIS
jgi:hypothetical protein